MYHDLVAASVVRDAEAGLPQNTMWPRSRSALLCVALLVG